MKTTWTVSDVSSPIKLNQRNGGLDVIEFKDDKGEWHNFDLIATAERIVFGSYCNAGFLESGYILRDECESIDETLQEMLSDLEVYYNDGPQYVSRIVCNERM